MRIAALALAALVLFAGCSTVSPTADDPGGATDLAPASVPGIQENDSVDTRSVYDATADVVRNRSVRVNAVVSTPTSTQNVTFVASENRTRLRLRLDDDDQFLNASAYAFRTDTTARIVRGETAQYRPMLTNRVRSVVTVVGLVNYTVAGTTTWQGSDVVELNVTGGIGGAPEDLSGTVYVSPDGYAVHADVTSESANTSVSFSITDVGSATVETPAWVATADHPRESRDDGSDADTLTRSSDYVNASITLRGVPEDATRADVRLRPIATSADNPIVNATVSHFFLVQYDGDFENATLRVQYDESAVPGAESDLRLYRLTQTDTVVVSDRVKAGENVVVADTTDLSGIFVVMDKPTYQRIQNQSSTTTANA